MFGKRSRRAAVILLVVLSTVLMVPEGAFAIGGPPPVDIWASPHSQSVGAGGSTTFDLDIFLSGGLKVGYLNLSAVDLPLGVAVTFNPDTFTIPGEYPYKCKMVVKVAEDMPPQKTELHVEGIAFYYAMGNGNSLVLTGRTLVTLNITAPPPKTTMMTQTVTLTSVQTSTSTSTATQLSTLTNTTTEQVTDPSVYAWALGATVAAAVLAIVLAMRRKNNP